MVSYQNERLPHAVALPCPGAVAAPQIFPGCSLVSPPNPGISKIRGIRHSCMSACLGTRCMHAVPPPNLARVRALGMFLSRRLWIGGHPELIESSPGIHHDDGGLLGCKVWPHKSLCQVLNKIGVGRLNPCTMAGVCATELDHSMSVQWSMMNVLSCEVMSWKWSHLL